MDWTVTLIHFPHPTLPLLPGCAHRSYRALYRVLCRKVAAVKLSCQQYHAFVSHVNIRVNNLALQQDKDVTSYIEDWFKEQEVGGYVD